MLSVEDYKRFEKCANVISAGMLEESIHAKPNMTERHFLVPGKST
jgi:hypothetical protein